jgi:bifunctional oligoribonuclease and PAP phosphatase NrnA
MEHKFREALTLIAQSERILITTHERTDGDDLGTALALYNHLSRTGKQVAVSIVGGVPKQLRFLPGSEAVTEDLPHTNFDLLIVSGCSQLARIGNEAIINLNVPIINFDHHRDNTDYATVNVVDPVKSSVAELVFDFFQINKWPITSQIATCLLTGIFTDTGSFMHSNTESSTFQAASELMRKGALLNTVAKHTFQGKDINALHAWGRALENTYFDEKNKIIYSIITDQDIKELGNIPPSTFEGLVETLNKVPDAKMAVFLKQDGGIIKGSLRSETYKGVNVNKIAKLFGGGGHALASGFSLMGKLIKDESGKWQVVS